MRSYRLPAGLGQWIAIAIRRAAWAPVLVFAVNVLLWLCFGAYSLLPWLDIPMHFIGGTAIAYFALHAVEAAVFCGLIGSPHRSTVRLASFLFACAAAVFWELAEYIADPYIETKLQHGTADTIFDVLLGIGGALCYLACALKRDLRQADGRSFK
jgi:hypothetical protein